MSATARRKRYWAVDDLMLRAFVEVFRTLDRGAPEQHWPSVGEFLKAWEHVVGSEFPGRIFTILDRLVFDQLIDGNRRDGHVVSFTLTPTCYEYVDQLPPTLQPE